MVKLDYQTNNPRWGRSGLCFTDWRSYSYTLGYLSNPAHNWELHPKQPGADVSIRFELNNKQGAWGKEGRIHFYGSRTKLKSLLPDLDAHSIDGTGRTTRRINSNGYVRSLLEDYHFVRSLRPGGSTVDVFPPEDGSVRDRLEGHLSERGLSALQIGDCLDAFEAGYNA